MQMVEIIPSINVKTFAEVLDRIAEVAPYVKWCHLDVTDGVFSKHETWRDPSDLPKLVDFLSNLVGADPTKQGLTLLNTEVHLMIAEPEKVIEKWLVPPVKRLVVHIEAMKNPELIIQKCREAGGDPGRSRARDVVASPNRTVGAATSNGIEIGFAVNPETSWDKLRPWFGPVRSLMPKAPTDATRRLTSNGVNKVDMVQVLAVNPGPSGQKMSEDTYVKIRHIREACAQCIIEVDGGVNMETAKKAVEAGANLLVAGAYVFNSSDIPKAIEALKPQL